MKFKYIIYLNIINLILISNCNFKDSEEKIIKDKNSKENKIEVKNMDCTFWLNKVDTSVKIEEDMLIDTMSDIQILNGMQCLLNCEGNKNEGGFAGATNIYVSQIFPKTTVELAALFYISYLFYQRWDHADGIAIWGPGGIINPKGSIEIAYKYYKSWFKQVKLIGLIKAREKKLDPLKGSGLSWYGNCRE
jgi:hypothetical protein